jgi:curved DNA-binding protein CbpA
LIDYYQILGLPETASSGDIKTAFKQLAVKLHPDKNPNRPDLEEQFKTVNEAYQTLNNPYKKARYDLQRKFGTPYEYEPITYERPASPPPSYHRHYRSPKPSHQENWKATLYAFGFTFAVACVVMTAIGIKNYYDSIQEEERQVTRRVTFDNAKLFYQGGNLDSAFILVNSLGGFAENLEVDMENFKIDLISEMKENGLTNFRNGNYQQAIIYLELLDKYTEMKELSLKESLALSYKYQKEPEKSIYVFTQLLLRGYRKIFAYVQMAEIYRDDLGSLVETQKHFELANLAAKEYYESAYGKAYAVILHENMLPELHFSLYTGLADSYLKLGEAEKAISITQWNLQVWPSRQENYLIAATGYSMLGDEVLAKEYLTAMQKIARR